jgi:hypothetical protein
MAVSAPVAAHRQMSSLPTTLLLSIDAMTTFLVLGKIVQAAPLLHT